MRPHPYRSHREAAYLTKRSNQQQRRTKPESVPAADLAAERVTRMSVIVVMAAVLVLVSYVRLRLADAPLERDEGEYAYAGQLIIDGTAPYAEAYNMKFPGTYYTYAALMSIFGETARGIRTGLLVVNLTTALLLFGVGRRVAGTLVGGIAASAFALMTLDQWSLALFAHATHFVTLPVVAAVFILMSPSGQARTGRLVFAGALMGLAITMKQHAVPFTALAMALAAWRARPSAPSMIRAAVLVGVGVLLTMTLLVALLASEGVLNRFWFWTVQYGAAYVSEISLADAAGVLGYSWQLMTRTGGWLWYAGAAGLIVLFVTRWSRETRLVVLAWTIAAVLAVIPGFYFRPHYFIVLMPAAALLVGVAIAGAGQLLARALGPTRSQIAALAVFLALVAVYVGVSASCFFVQTPDQVVRSTYGGNPFNEAPMIARYIRDHSSPGDRIAILGSEPEIFFYADRKSATGYIYTYALMEPQPFASRMQLEMRQEIEAARPEYFIFVGTPTSWGTRQSSDLGILRWADEFAAACYERVGIADIHGAADSVMLWDEQADGYQGRFVSQVHTLRRVPKPGCSGPSK